MQAFNYIIELVSKNKEAWNLVYEDCKSLSDVIFNIIMNEDQSENSEFEVELWYEASAELK